MTSKPRARDPDWDVHITTDPNCVRKRRYNRTGARDTAKRVTARLGERVDAYKCDSCHGWHIGHDSWKGRK